MYTMLRDLFQFALKAAGAEGKIYIRVEITHNGVPCHLYRVNVDNEDLNVLAEGVVERLQDSPGLSATGEVKIAFYSPEGTQYAYTHRYAHTDTTLTNNMENRHDPEQDDSSPDHR